jgi:hypothetical protein
MFSQLADFLHLRFACVFAQNPTFNVYHSHVSAHQALLAAQLAIMAWNAAPGASVVLRASMTWSHFT